jgi:hypothetical protein
MVPKTYLYAPSTGLTSHGYRLLRSRIWRSGEPASYRLVITAPHDLLFLGYGAVERQKAHFLCSTIQMDQCSCRDLRWNASMVDLHGRRRVCVFE